MSEHLLSVVQKTQLVFPIILLLSTGLEWDTSSLQTAGVIQVIPEPSTALLLGLGLTGLSWKGRRSLRS